MVVFALCFFSSLLLILFLSNWEVKQIMVRLQNRIYVILLRCMNFIDYAWKSAIFSILNIIIQLSLNLKLLFHNKNYAYCVWNKITLLISTSFHQCVLFSIKNVHAEMMNLQTKKKKWNGSKNIFFLCLFFTELLWWDHV